MSRADLLALTPEAVAALANMGLVKRAQREIEAGSGPALEESADGTVTGTFADGAVARLLPGRTLEDAPCSCRAATTCRHRVAVALAYRSWHARGQGGAPPVAPAPERWSPAEIGDEALERALGKKTLERARGLVARGVLVGVDSSAPPTAKLPSCTVRFLVPREVAYARCDCAEPGACGHIAIAVWAFRQAQADGVVALGAGADCAVELADLEGALALVRDLVATGIAHSLPSQARFAQARARSAGKVWIESLLLELEQALEAYHARSALYSAGAVRELVVELEARVRAARAGAELPVRYVLGEDEAPETLLDHVRLVSLGARLRADGKTRFAEIFLADPDTATVMVLGKRWEDRAEVGPALARRTLAARISLGQLATGQLVSRAVTRRANRGLVLGASRANQSSVTPQRGEWGSLPAPILIRDIEAHLASLQERPPAMLRPRVLAENVHVLAVDRVVDVAYVASEQVIAAVLADASGHTLRALVAHRAVAPHAVEAAGEAFAGPVRFVSGEVTRGPRGLTMEVLAIAGDGMVVPDLAGPARLGSISGRAVPDAPDPVRDALARATGLLEELLQVGLASADAQLLERVESGAVQLEDAGLAALARRLSALGRRAHRASGVALPERVDAWFDAAVRAALSSEVA